MTRYTYTSKFSAWTMSRRETVTIPDQVAAAQRDYDDSEKSFPVLRRDGTKARATLRGDEYGLHTEGTGDAVVALC